MGRILASDGSIDARCSEGRTPLHCWIEAYDDSYRCHISTIGLKKLRVLLSFKPDIYSRSTNRQHRLRDSVLETVAKGNGNPIVIQMLMRSCPTTDEQFETACAGISDADAISKLIMMRMVMQSGELLAKVSAERDDFHATVCGLEKRVSELELASKSS